MVRTARRPAQSHPPSLRSLPQEAVLHITRFISPQEILSLSQTCTAFYKILCHSDFLWCALLPPPLHASIRTLGADGVMPTVDPSNRKKLKPISKSLPSQTSAHLHRLNHVALHGEFSPRLHSWLVLTPAKHGCDWGFVTLGCDLKDIVWGNEEDGRDERYWTRCKVSFMARMHRCWRLDVSTWWTVTKGGIYRAFVLCKGPGYGSMGRVEVYVKCGGGKIVVGKLTGGDCDVVNGEWGERMFLFLSRGFEVVEMEDVKVGLVDRDSSRVKSGTDICGIGLVKEREGFEGGEWGGRVCYGLYLKALGHAKERKFEGAEAKKNFWKVWGRQRG